jgi:hypothetical protein
MAAEHIKEQYVKQIETASKDLQSAVKKLKEYQKDTKEWKTQFMKCEVAHEHYMVLVKGFDTEYNKQFKDKSAPNAMIALRERVKTQNVAVNFSWALVKK